MTTKPPLTPDPDFVRMQQLFASWAVCGVHEVLEPMWSPKEAEARFQDFDAVNAKDFFLYRILVDLQKAGFAMFRWRQFAERLQGEQKPHDLDLQAHVAEQSLWQRRLVEMLVRLIGFAQTNEVPYYYHYLLVADLERSLHEQAEQREFFGAESLWLKEHANARRRMLAELTATGRVDRKRCWYLTEADETTAGRGLLANTRTLIKLALKNATLMERRSLGYCYRNGFSEPSSAMHFEPLPTYRDVNVETFRFVCLQSGFLGMTVLTRVQELFGILRETEACKFARQSAQGGTPGKIAGTAKKGDFVIVVLGRKKPFLAEVTEVIVSQYGNESYSVQYLDEQPLPGMITDVVMPDRIAMYLEREGLLAESRAVLGGLACDEASALALAGIPQGVMDESMRKSAVETWTTAIRDVYTRQLEDALARK